MKGVFITGTNTNVGKTWVGTQLIKALVRKNIRVKPIKPVESGWVDKEVEKTDAWKLATATGREFDLDKVCPNHFKAPISPERAAKKEGVRLSLDTIIDDCISDARSHDFHFIEGAGGFYSPLCADGLNADLAKALNLPIILVAEDTLGCINQVLLNVEAIENRGLKLVAIVLNQQKEYENKLMDNKQDLKNRLNYPVLPVHYNKVNNNNFDVLCDFLLSSYAG